MSIRFPILLCCGFLVLGLLGCASYKVGPTNGRTAGDRSIQVNFFQNATLEARLVEAVCSALRNNLQHDGTFRLNTSGDADIVVNGTIIHYERIGLSFQPTDIITVRDYELRLIAHITAVDRNTGKTVLDRDVTGRTTIRAGPDPTSAERQALPLAADDLARTATSLLVDGSW
jgi:hypothetical protein